MNLNMNPKVLHVLLEAGQVASGVATVATFAHSIPIPSPYSLVVGAVGAIATGYLTWLKAQNVGNINPSA